MQVKPSLSPGMANRDVVPLPACCPQLWGKCIVGSNQFYKYPRNRKKMLTLATTLPGTLTGKFSNAYGIFTFK